MSDAKWHVKTRKKRDGECGPGLWITEGAHPLSGGRFVTVVDTGALDAWPLSSANKRIIEYAPNLLETLEEILGLFGDIIEFGRDHDTISVLDYRKWQAANALAADVRDATQDEDEDG